MSNEEEEVNYTQEELFRFIQDLEFVQCLANPNYLKYLSDKGYLDDNNFLNYLKYLLYFKKVEYMKYLTYERCLLFLDLLQYKGFREQLKQNNYVLIEPQKQYMSYAQCLDDFILNDWRIRSIQEKDKININESNSNNEIESNQNKINNNNQEMEIEK